MKAIIMILLLLGTGSVSYAQNSGKLSGRLKDTETLENIISATVVVLDADYSTSTVLIMD